MHRADRLRVLSFVDELVVLVYEMTERFPRSERFGITAQVRRAAVSIGSNIVEGASYGTDPVFARHLRIARGSLEEVAYQLHLAHRLGFVENPAVAIAERRTVTIRRMLTSLIAHVEGSGRTDR